MKRITRKMNQCMKDGNVVYLTDEELSQARDKFGVEYDSVKAVRTSVPVEEFLKIADVKEIEEK